MMEGLCRGLPGRESLGGSSRLAVPCHQYLWGLEGGRRRLACVPRPQPAPVGALRLVVLQGCPEAGQGGGFVSQESGVTLQGSS